MSSLSGIVAAVPEWVPDSSAPLCMQCGVSFGLTIRRHHCRGCGRVVCDSCSKARRTLQAEPNKVRVCDDCDQDMEEDEENEDSVSGPPTPVAAAPAAAAAPVVAAPIPVATVPKAAPKPAAAVPVAATAPRLVPPTAAPIASAGGGSGGGLFAGLANRLQAHAPGLVQAVKDQMAAAASKQQQEEAAKKAHAQRIIADANGETPVAAAAVASPAARPTPAAGGDIAHIPGLGPIALAAAPADQKKEDAQVWSQMQAPPANPESELRRRGSKAPGSLSKQGSMSSPAAATGAASFKMDLPLRLCLVILKKTSAEMREKYSEYLATKTKRNEGDEPLSFQQFMFFCTIRTLPDFLWRKTELAYCMMREEGDTLVFLDNFRRYAPILTPLASKLDAEHLFLALQHASIQTGAALSQEQVDQEEEDAEAEESSESESDSGDSADEAAATDAVRRSPKVKAKFGGVGFVQFKAYVDALKKCTHADTESGWPDFRTMGTAPPAAAGVLEKHEQLLVVRGGVTDTTTFPPHIGRLGLTTNFLIYESSIFSRRRCIRWTNIVRIEKNEEGFWRKGTSGGATPALTAHTVVSASSPSSGSSPSSSSSGDAPTKGMKIYILDDSVEEASAHGVAGAKRELCLTMDIPGWGDAAILERARTFEYIRIMIQLHKLVVSLPDKVVASALIQETCTTMQRMRALEAVGHGCNPLLLNPFSPERLLAQQRQQQQQLQLSMAKSPREELVAASSIPEPPSSASASASFVSSIQASISRADLIRKSKSSWLFAVLPGLQNKEQESLMEDIDPELSSGQYKTAEELLKLQRAHEQPFSLKNFAYNVKLFRYEIEPLMLFIALMKRLRDWENPVATLFTVMMLLNMAYRDYLAYLPALLILINIAIVAVLRFSPNAVWVALGGPQAEAAEAAAAARQASGAQIEELDADGAPLRSGRASSGPSSSSNREAKDELESDSASSSSSGSARQAPTAQPVRKEKEDEVGLLQKLKNYRDVAVKTKDYLHSVQNSVADRNVQFMKLEGLYKWRSPHVTQKFFGLLCAGFVIMAFIPFRFIFPILVLDFFTSKWQREGSLERLLNEVTLPARMPDLD